MPCRGNSCPQNNSRRSRFMRASAMHRQPFRLLLRKIHPPLHREGKYSLAPLCKRSWRRSRLRGCSCACGDRPRRPVKLRNGRIISAPTNRCRESKGLPPDVGRCRSVSEGGRGVHAEKRQLFADQKRTGNARPYRKSGYPAFIQIDSLKPEYKPSAAE